MKSLIVISAVIIVGMVVSSAQAPMPDLNPRTIEALRLSVKYLDSVPALPPILYGDVDSLSRLSVRQLEDTLAAAKQREADIDKIKLVLRDLESLAAQPRLRVMPSLPSNSASGEQSYQQPVTPLRWSTGESANTWPRP